MEINVVAAAEVLEPEDADLIFNRLLDILDEWKAVRANIFKTIRMTFATVAGTASYLVGPAATWDAARPEQIIAAGFVNTYVNPTAPLETPMTPFTDVQWARVAIKSLQSTVCDRYWYETSLDGSGFSKFYPYPVPSVAAQVALYLPTPLTDPTTIDDSVVMPPAMKRALRTTLAIDICDGFERNPSATLIQKNRNALRAMRQMNVKPGVLPMPTRLMRGPGRGSGYNILTNE